MNTLLDLGARLVVARRVAGMSQRALGELLGVMQQQIARWEATKYRGASLERVDSASRALGMSSGDAKARWSAAETQAAYGPAITLTPVRDLGEIAARIRAHGEEFRDVYRMDRIGVFGSFASGEQTPDSDVDLLVETKDPGGFRFIRAADFAEEILGRKVDFCEPEYLRERLRKRVLEDVVYVWTT